MSGKFMDMGDKNWAVFSEALSGTLHVESIEGTRFSGRYTFTANNHSGESAEVSGKIDHAKMPLNQLMRNHRCQVLQYLPVDFLVNNANVLQRQFEPAEVDVLINYTVRIVLFDQFGIG
jgi:hypothetical protein